MRVFIIVYFLLLGCSSFSTTVAAACSSHSGHAATTTKKAGVECAECNISYCPLPLQRDANGCEICSCNVPECEGLLPLWCTNPCLSQSCSEYRANGEPDDSQCVPKEGDATCETGCGCPGGEKVEYFVSPPYARCVTTSECGCSDPNAPNGYLKLGHRYQKAATVELCTCVAGNTVKCEDDPKPECDVEGTNGCYDKGGCRLIVGRDGCYICVCR